MASYQVKSDILFNIHKTAGYSGSIGFDSVYTQEEHPATGKKIEGFQWEKRPWPLEDEELEEYAIPTIYDPGFYFAGTSDWQSGIGGGDDVELLSINEAYVTKSGHQWAPRLYHGYFYNYRQENYLFSEGLTIDYFDETVDSGNFQYIQMSEYPKPTIPILARNYYYDRDKARYYVRQDFRKKADFTPTVVSGEYSFVRDDDGNLLHSGVNVSDPEFIVYYEYNDQKPYAKLNGNYLTTAQEDVTVSGVDGWCEEMGVSNGEADQIFHTYHSPITPSGEVNVYTYHTTNSGLNWHVQEWNVVSGENPTFSGAAYDCIVDRYWGVIEFGDGSNGYIPSLGDTVAVQYTGTVMLTYEADDTPDYYDAIGEEADTNPLNGASPNGFVKIRAAETDPVYIRLSADLDVLADGTYGPLSLGETYAKLLCEVTGGHGELLEGVDVTFEMSDQIVGDFGLGETSIVGTTDKDGEAVAFYSPPTSLDDIGDYTTDITYSGVNTILGFDDLVEPNSDSFIYTYQVLREDLVTGYPESESNSYYEDYFGDEDIGYSSLSSEITQEGNYRAAHSLLTPVTYAKGDIETGTKKAVLTYDDTVLHPHTGELGAYTLLSHQSWIATEEGVDVTYSGHLDAITTSGSLKSYFVATSTMVRFKASIWSDKLQRRIYSNEISISIEIPDHMSGRYAVDAIENVDSDLLSRAKTDAEFLTYYNSLIDGGVFSDSDTEERYMREREPSTETRQEWFERTRRADNVLLGLENVSTSETGSLVIPLGYRLKSTGITAAAALDSCVYLDANDTFAAVTLEELPFPTTKSLYGIAYNEGRYVAGGEDVSFFYSDDCYSWNEASVDAAVPVNADFLAGIAYGGGVFVTAGVHYILYSDDDGESWQIGLNDGSLSAWGVCYGNGLFVVVGNNHGGDAFIYTSPDGIHWTERANPKDFDLREVTYGNGLYVAVGEADGGDAYIVTSPDGIHWTERANPGNYTLYSVSYDGAVGNERFIAGGASAGATPYVITSPNGVDWTQQVLSEDGIVLGSTFGDGLFVMTGALADGVQAIWISADGESWHRQDASGFVSDYCYAVAYTGEMYVGVGNEIATGDGYITLIKKYLKQ